MSPRPICFAHGPRTVGGHVVLRATVRPAIWAPFCACGRFRAWLYRGDNAWELGLRDQAYRDYRRSDLLRMLLLAPLDFVLYRPLIMLAGLRGYVDFLRGRKSWDTFERNPRAACRDYEGDPNAKSEQN